VVFSPQDLCVSSDKNVLRQRIQHAAQDLCGFVGRKEIAPTDYVATQYLYVPYMQSDFGFLFVF
jgi:hypothetical protein